MLDNRAYKSLNAAVTVAIAAFVPNVLAAQSNAGASYFPQCPVDTDIRVGNPRAAHRFSALSGCEANIVHVTPTPLPADPSVARIMGVEDEDETPAKRRARERARRTSARTVTPTVQVSRVPVSAYDAHIFRTASAYKVDPLFLHAIIATESAHNPRAVSYVGARGLMQIMPATGKTLGVQSVALFDPAINVDAGARLLKRLQKKYGRKFDLILGAYNAGEGAVARYGNRVPPYRETQDYVRKVMARYTSYRSAGLMP